MSRRLPDRGELLAASCAAAAGFLLAAGVLLGWPWLVPAILVGAASAAAVLFALMTLRRSIRGALRRELRRVRKDARRSRQLARRLARTSRTKLRAADAANDVRYRRLRTATDAAAQRVRRASAEDAAQLAAFVQLLDLAGVREALPRSRGYPASPDALLELVALIRERRPALYVDFGAGLSTVIAASTVRLIGSDTRVVGVEHDPQFAARTQELVDRHGLTDLVELRLAPLVPVAGGPEHRWYDPAVLADLHGVELAFVDGPPGHLERDARAPVREFLTPRLAERAIVVLDDTGRDAESRLAESWAEDLRATRLHRPAAEKGLAILEFCSSSE